MMKLEDLLLCTDDEWLSSGQETLPVCIWKSFQIHWVRKFLVISIIPKGRDICTDCFISSYLSKNNKVTLYT